MKPLAVWPIAVLVPREKIGSGSLQSSVRARSSLGLVRGLVKVSKSKRLERVKSKGQDY